MNRCAIGVDIGAGTTKLALVGREGAIFARDCFPTPGDPEPEVITARIVAAVLTFRDRVTGSGFPIDGVGFAVPSFSEGEDWIQRHTNNAPSLEGFPMYPPLREAFGPTITMMNDVSAAGIAEYRFGRGRGCDRMLLMAIGTGIATSLVTEEHGLVKYSWDTTGDTGQIIVDPFGLADCSCGGRGCLEAVAAGPAIRRRALAEVEREKRTLLAEMKTRKGDLEARDVAEAAKVGDPVARDIMDQVGFYVGVALTSYLHIFSPSLIVLGGGVAGAGELLIEPVRRTMNRLASPWYMARLRGIEVSALGNDSAAIGCASPILFPGERM